MWLFVLLNCFMQQGIDESDALKSFRKLHCDILRDGNTDGHPIVALRVGAGSAFSDRDISQLRYFPSLKSLNLSSASKLTDASAEQLLQLQNLTTLDLSYSTTDEGLRVLHHLKRLKHLSLSSTRVSDQGMLTLSALPELEYLDVTNTRITDAGLEHLHTLPKLRSLCLYSTSTSAAGVAGLAKVATLSFLKLGGSQVTDDSIKTLPTYPALKHLQVMQSTITDAGVAKLSECLHLKQLDLANHYDRLTLRAIKSISEMKGLVGLSLTDMTLGDEDVKAIGSMSALKSLNLCHTGISSASFAHLKNMPDLRELYIGNNRDLFELSFLGQFPNLVTLSVSGSEISRWKGLEQCARLECLNLEKCLEFQDADLKWIENMPHLRELYILFTGITDEGLSNVLRAHKQLKVLSLNGTITDASVKYIVQNKELRVVDVSRTRITAEGIRRIESMLPHAQVIRFDTGSVAPELIDVK